MLFDVVPPVHPQILSDALLWPTKSLVYEEEPKVIYYLMCAQCDPRVPGLD
jgi:hypothetical protein